MEDPVCCPNIINCHLVLIPGFAGSKELQGNYVLSYCRSENENWKSCKRFIVKNTLNFCPDFVMPDTDLSPDEVLDKFDALNLN